MTKSTNTGLAKKVDIKRKLPPKKTTINTESIDRAVAEIHQDEPTSKASVILPRSLYKKMKQRALDMDMTVSACFRHLLDKDLNK